MATRGTTAGTVREAITEANRRFMERFKKGDTTGISQCYTRDAVVMPPNHDFVRGREAIAGFWRGLVTAGVKAVTLETQQLEEMGETICETGTFEVQIEGDETIDHGKYIVIWRQEDGQWKLYRDIWNSSKPVR